MTKENTPQPILLSKYGLFLLTALVLSIGYFIWQIWPSLLTSGMQWQKAINNQLSDLLYDAQTNILNAGLSLAGLSFLYGILHSVGPGHGKLIVSTYLATHPTKVKISLTITILSALLQAIVAILLVSTLLLIFQSSMHEINNKANLFIALSFYVLILLGGIIVYRSLRFICKEFSFQQKNKNTITTLHKNDSPLNSLDGKKNHTDTCNHKHVTSAQEINQASSAKEYLVIIFSIGIRPCTGAIMVLLFANMVDIYWLGVLSAFVMAIGTAITTSTIAIMTVSGRQLVMAYLTLNNCSSNKLRLSSPLIQLIGGLLLILMGSVLLSSQPVGMSPIF